ncbi:LAFA_0D08548g1_1 [Lachancea sp. 'fantastica']|nr:LAFA_0D08548g1_1 [Lachancea sp. 'fantastica']
MKNTAAVANAELVEGLELWSKKPVHVRRLSSPAPNRTRKASFSAEYVKKNGNLLRNEVDSRSIFLRNISSDANASLLERHFERFGTINRITIFSKRSDKKLKCYAYIEFDSVDSAENSLSLNKSILENHTIDVLKKRTNMRGWRGDEHS